MIHVFVVEWQKAPMIVERVSVSSDGEPGNCDPDHPTISGDALRVVFGSDATNLVAGDTNGLTDVFLYELSSGAITRVSINSLEEQAVGGGSLAPAISADGRFIAFESDATNLVPVDAGGHRDIFFRDRGSMCEGDLNGDFVVDAFDLAILLGAWGPVDPCPPFHPVDLDFDCDVGAGDLAILLGNWGICL